MGPGLGARSMGEPWAHPTCLTHPFHNAEAPSSLTLAKQPRGHITGQLQEAGGAGPAVFLHLAGCALPTAHTLPGTVGQGHGSRRSGSRSTAPHVSADPTLTPITTSSGPRLPHHCG